MVLRHLGQIISPLPLMAGHAAAPVTAPKDSARDNGGEDAEERVRGKTRARDACHQAAEERHLQPHDSAAASSDAAPGAPDVAA